MAENSAEAAPTACLEQSRRATKLAGPGSPVRCFSDSLSWGFLTYESRRTFASLRQVSRPADTVTRAEADDPGGPEYVAKASVTAEHERGLNLTGTTQTGAVVRVEISIAAPGIVRVLLEGETSDPQRVTLARDLSDQRVNVSLEKSEGRVTLVSDLVSAQIDLDPFHITFYGADGRAILGQNYTDSDVTDRLAVLPLGFSIVEVGHAIWMVQ